MSRNLNRSFSGEGEMTDLWSSPPELMGDVCLL